MAADDQFERRLGAALHSLLDRTAGPNPTWADSPAARRIAEPIPFARRHPGRGLLLVAAALIVSLAAGAAFIGGLPPARVVPPVSPSTTTTPSVTPAPTSSIAAGLVPINWMVVAGQSLDAAAGTTGPVVSMVNLSGGPEAMQIYRWTPDTGWVGGPSIAALGPGGLGPLPWMEQHATDGLTFLRGLLVDGGRQVWIAPLTETGEFQQVGSDTVLTADEWGLSGALHEMPGGGYASVRTSRLLVIHPDMSFDLADLPPDRSVLAPTNDPALFLLTVRAAVRIDEVPGHSYPVWVWNRTTNQQVAVADTITAVEPAYKSAGLAWVQRSDRSWTALAPDGTLGARGPVPADPTHQLDIDPSGRYLFERSPVCSGAGPPAPTSNDLCGVIALRDAQTGRTLHLDFGSNVARVSWLGNRAVFVRNGPVGSDPLLSQGLVSLGQDGPQLIGFPGTNSPPSP
jgi:hypothetical protein